MAVAVIADFPVTADVIEVPDAPSIAVGRNSGSMGSRVVGVTTILGVLTLMILLGLAVIQTMITERHVELTNLQAEIAEIQSSIGALELEAQNARTPIRVEHLAEGYYAAIKAESSTQIQVRSTHLAIRKPTGTQAHTRLTSTGGSVDQLLARTTPVPKANKGQ
tara:strand:+ start:1678 stop:2169 length:492 start_codon:yes stop_codon:yes gene_type:complete